MSEWVVLLRGINVGGINIKTTDGTHDDYTTATVLPRAARAIAAELIRLADEIEAEQ